MSDKFHDAGKDYCTCRQCRKARREVQADYERAVSAGWSADQLRSTGRRSYSYEQGAHSRGHDELGL